MTSPTHDAEKWAALAMLQQERLVKQDNKIDALLSVFRLIAMPGRADEDAAQLLTEIRQIARRVLKENQP